MILSSCVADESAPGLSVSPKPGLVSGTEDITEYNISTWEDNPILQRELRGCVDYFWNETNIDPKSAGYGITRDNTDPRQRNFGSIAATGHALAAYAIGAEKGYVDKDEAERRALGTLKTFYETVPNEHGFFHHFLRLSDGQRYYQSELSTIDTALFLAGAVVAAEYFGGEVMDTYKLIYDRVEWDWMYNKEKNMFRMAYDENGSGQFSKANWDTFAEQFIMYVFGAGSDTHPVDGEIFYGFNRWKDHYGDYEFIRSYGNSLFVYQFSHAFLDLRGLKDRDGVDWFDNSVQATKAARQYCIDNAHLYKTYSENSWGLAACMSKNGYQGAFGADPTGMPGEKKNVNNNDGTVAIYATIGSINFTPDEAIAAMNHYETYPELWGEYGFKDSYNLDQDYFCPIYIGLDKGDSMEMLSNYLDGFIWDLFMRNENVQKGLKACELQ